MIYGYINKTGEHVNIDLRTLEGCPIQPIINFPYGEPAAVLYFTSEEQAESFYNMVLDRNLEYADEFDALDLVPLVQEWLDAGNYTLVPAVCD